MARRSAYIQRLWYRVRTVDQISGLVTHHNKKSLAVMLFLVLLSSFSVAYYFTNRIESVMIRYEINLSANISYDLLHLQIQFLLGMISLAMIVILVIILYQKNFSYLNYEARMDELTGLLGRGQFFQMGQQILDNRKFDHNQNEKAGCFIIMDVDHFKEINDSYGHPAGDKVLKAVADNLRKVLGDQALLGRLGGDEFVALMHQALSRQEVETLLNRLKEGNGLFLKNDKY